MHVRDFIVAYRTSPRFSQFDNRTHASCISNIHKYANFNTFFRTRTDLSRQIMYYFAIQTFAKMKVFGTNIIIIFDNNELVKYLLITSEPTKFLTCPYHAQDFRRRIHYKQPKKLEKLFCSKSCTCVCAPSTRQTKKRQDLSIKIFSLPSLCTSRRKSTALSDCENGERKFPIRIHYKYKTTLMTIMTVIVARFTYQCGVLLSHHRIVIFFRSAQKTRTFLPLCGLHYHLLHLHSFPVVLVISAQKNILWSISG